MMEYFEIHITGDKLIIEQAKKLGIKTIVIDLLKPDRTYFRTEYMTSFTHTCENYNECKKYVDKIVEQLIDLKVKIKRVKIECMFYKHYVEQSLYCEIHQAADYHNTLLPMSQNQNKDCPLITAREYNKDQYNKLIFDHCRNFCPPKDQIIELCLFDSNIEEDKDWFDLYGRISSN